MSEFLKNNPIVLRHCLLYEFLRKNPVEESFNAFCKTVGDNVIEREKFQFWFNQFEQGIFDTKNDNGPISDMRDVFLSDKYALRAAAFYETLKSKKNRFSLYWHPRFSPCRSFQENQSIIIYEKLCKVIGDDVMEYRNFAFWFHRFLNEQFDLNYEKDENQKIYELLDMPLDVMEKVMEFLSYSDSQALTRTCRSAHQFVQNQKVFHDTLEISIHVSSAYISFASSDAKYEKIDNGCVKQFKRNETLFQGVPYWNKALLDFKNIITNPKLHLDSLKVTFDMNYRMMVYEDEELETMTNPYEELEIQIIDELEAVLKSANQLYVKKLIFRASSVETLLKTLPYLKPGYLTTLHISIDFPTGFGMDKVVEMEQWKQAKHFNSLNLYSIGSLHHLFHFKGFNVYREEITVEDIRQMKEILFKSPNFEKCWLLFENPIDTSAIKREFDIAFREDTHYYPIPNSTEYFEIRVVDVDGYILQISRKKK